MGHFVVSADIGRSIGPTAVSVLEVFTRRDLVKVMNDHPPGPPVPIHRALASARSLNPSPPINGNNKTAPRPESRSR